MITIQFTLFVKFAMKSKISNIQCIKKLFHEFQRSYSVMIVLRKLRKKVNRFVIAVR